MLTPFILPSVPQPEVDFEAGSAPGEEEPLGPADHLVDLCRRALRAPYSLQHGGQARLDVSTCSTSWAKRASRDAFRMLRPGTASNLTPL